MLVSGRGGTIGTNRDPSAGQAARLTSPCAEPRQDTTTNHPSIRPAQSPPSTLRSSPFAFTFFTFSKILIRAIRGCRSLKETIRPLFAFASRLHLLSISAPHDFPFRFQLQPQTLNSEPKSSHAPAANYPTKPLRHRGRKHNAKRHAKLSPLTADQSPVNDPLTPH